MKPLYDQELKYFEIKQEYSTVQIEVFKDDIQSITSIDLDMIRDEKLVDRLILDAIKEFLK